MSIIKNTLATFGAIGFAARLHGLAMNIYLTKRIGEDYTELVRETRTQRNEYTKEAMRKTIFLCARHGEIGVANHLEGIHNLFEMIIEAQEEQSQKANK